MPLTDLNLRPVYNHSNCPDLLAGLYEPLLAQAVRYDRTTYTFTAKGLIAAAAGTAGLIRNGGRIRLICDYSVKDDVLQAIHSGQLDAEAVLQQTASREDLLLTEAADIADRNHLELAYWLVANGIMEVKVAIRGDRIFHNKSGIVEDAHGNRVAFAGSLNETLSGWRHNWESVDVYTENEGLAHLEARQSEFQALWTNRAAGLRVIDLPAYYRDYIGEHAPASPPEIKSIRERRRGYTVRDRAANDYWQRIYDALANDPDSTAATIPATLWPHQERFRQQNVGNDAVRRLIADEVGLGKTLQAGIILKTRLNQGKARRALIISPKAATKQWQSELLMKFAIDAPIIDSHGCYYRDGRTEPGNSPPWSTPLAIAGHQWLVRNADDFLSTCGEYDIVIVDEAHRARFRDVDHEQRRQPNQYLRLLSQLSRRTRELLLLTATPMQLNEVELWALLELLEPEGWHTAEYRRFYKDDELDLPEWKFRRDLWRKTNPPETGDFLLASDNDDYIASQLDDPGTLQATLETMRRSSPAKRLMSRHTRELLRRYRRQGLLDAPVPQRQARDVVITMTPQERALYDGIRELVRQCYADRGITPQSLGFITTIFRKRFGSSTRAYAQTLRNAANRIPQDADDWMTLLDDTDLDELTDGETNALNNAANLDALLKAADEAERLSQQDSKRGRLTGVIAELREQGHNHILLFTQFRDTQSWLSEHLQRSGHFVTELFGQDGHLGDRGRRLEEFQQQGQGILLCTETASESLNLQFCSAVVNYDIPWNPMTLEQRAGRIDRIGQERSVVDVINLFYENTAEHDAYKAVERRFKGIVDNVGAYPPIIAANIQSIIRDGKDPDAELDKIAARNDFDINRLNAEWEEPNAQSIPGVTMDDLEKPLRQPELMPEGWSVTWVGGKHWEVTDPPGRLARVTTDAEAYQQADGRLQWWSGPRRYSAGDDSEQGHNRVS